jgi:hypothetical protein
MKAVLNRFVLVLLISSFTGSAAFAETIKQEVTFIQSVVVNGTEVPKGTYDAVFDDQTNELSIVKGKKVIAKSPAKLEARGEKDKSVHSFRAEGDKRVLLTVAFKKKQATLVNDENSATSAK